MHLVGFIVINFTKGTLAKNETKADAQCILLFNKHICYQLSYFNRILHFMVSNVKFVLIAN